MIETGLGDCVEAIKKLDELAKILRRQRYENGSVEFDRAEVKFHIDEAGKPLGVFFKVSKDANKLIEEFMLLANRTVATFVGKPQGKKKPRHLSIECMMSLIRPVWLILPQLPEHSATKSKHREPPRRSTVRLTVCLRR